MGKRSESWPPWAVKSSGDKLDLLVDAVRDRGEMRTDDEQMWLTRFLVVRSCGYLEQAVHESVRAHLRNTSGGTALSFSLSWLERSRNPSPDNLLTIAGRFGAPFREDLESYLEENDKERRRELSLLVDRRNSIAHGMNEGLNDAKALQLADLAKETASWFLSKLKP